MRYPKSITILVLSFALVICLWLLAVSGWVCWLKVETLEPLFTGLALGGLIATVVRERENSAEQNAAHKELIATMTKQVAVNARTTLIAAITARIDGYHDQIRRTPLGPDKTRMTTERESLYLMLAKEIEHLFQP
jgi:hypothetical protein